MSAMKDPNSMSESDIQSFFNRQEAWEPNETRAVIEKDPRTLEVSSSLQEDDPALCEMCLDAASDSSCCLCGQHPCSKAPTKALLTIKPSKRQFCCWGICAECSASTIGESKLKLFYRAWFSQIEKGKKPKWIGILDDGAYSFDAALP
jgi:hypothetical protein